MKQSEVNVHHLLTLGWTASTHLIMHSAASAIRQGSEIRVFSEPCKDVLMISGLFRLERENK